ncbi:hypothetical protein DFJ74DRAFT_38719 [Hyaloraphidium curvatum]|nr:hypothetical protein DFJ74DRAFT_38719 [Hyaloraphidium curvatum]
MLPFLWINGPAHGFGQRQLAVTVAVIAFENAAYSFGVPLMRWLAWSGGRQPRRDDPEERKPDTVSGGFVKVATLDGWPEAVFWRYNMLRKSASEDSESPFLLLQHRADDLLGCCCPRAECAGSVPRRAATARVAALAIILLLFCFMYITRYFTFLVTLGGQLWTTPWAVAGVLLIPLLLDNEFVSVLGGAAMTDNLVARDLERRLEGRALGHALDSLVAHFRGMVDGGVEGPAAPCESWYLDLVPLLAARWQQDTVLPQMVALAGFFFGTEAIAMVVYIVGSPRGLRQRSVILRTPSCRPRPAVYPSTPSRSSSWASMRSSSPSSTRSTATAASPRPPRPSNPPPSPSPASPPARARPPPPPPSRTASSRTAPPCTTWSRRTWPVPGPGCWGCP